MGWRKPIGAHCNPNYRQSRQFSLSGIPLPALCRPSWQNYNHARGANRTTRPARSPPPEVAERRGRGTVGTDGEKASIGWKSSPIPQPHGWRVINRVEIPIRKINACRKGLTCHRLPAGIEARQHSQRGLRTESGGDFIKLTIANSNHLPVR